MQIRMPWILTAVTCAVLAACDRYGTGLHEVHVRILPERNELFLLEVQHDLHALGRAEKRLAHAIESLDEVLGGRRRYPPHGWLTIDFDAAPEEILEEDESPEVIALFTRWLEFAPSVHVERVGLSLEEDDGASRLDFHRLTRISNLDRGVELLNDTINVFLIEEYFDGDDTFEHPEWPIFDERTFELWSAHAAAGRPWITIGKDEIVIEIPMTPANAARWLEAIVEEGSSAPLLPRLRALEVTDERARLRFPLSGQIHERRTEREDARTALREHYVESGYDFDEAGSVDEARELFAD